jgi:hypothetical protein
VAVKITTGATSLYMGSARRFARKTDFLDDIKKFDAEDEVRKNERAHELIETSLAAVILSYTEVEAVLPDTNGAHTHARPTAPADQAPLQQCSSFAGHTTTTGFRAPATSADEWCQSARARDSGKSPCRRLLHLAKIM